TQTSLSPLPKEPGEFSWDEEDKQAIRLKFRAVGQRGAPDRRVTLKARVGQASPEVRAEYEPPASERVSFLELAKELRPLHQRHVPRSRIVSADGRPRAI